MCCPTCGKFPCSVVTTLRTHDRRHGGLPAPHYHFCHKAEACDFDCVPCGKLIREAGHLPRSHFEFGCCHRCEQYAACTDSVIRHTRWSEVAAIAFQPKPPEPAAPRVPPVRHAAAVAHAEASAHRHAEHKSPVSNPGRVLVSEVAPAPGERPAPGEPVDVEAKARAHMQHLAEHPVPHGTMNVRCGGCGTVHHVPRKKAGKRGRCPTCGSVIHVPFDDLQSGSVPVPTHHWGRRAVLVGVGCALGLLLLIILLVSIGGNEPTPEKDATAVPGAPLTPRATVAAVAVVPKPEPVAPPKVDALEVEIARLKEFEQRIQAFQQLRQQERRWRARDILSRIRSYEAVSPAEYELRNEVQSEQRSSAGEWRLETPLTASEQQEMNRAPDTLRQQGMDIQRDLARLGLACEMKKDALGRTFVDADKALAQVAAKRQRLQTQLDGGAPAAGTAP